ncbi:immunoglobulin-like domain-containing protein [Rubritalea spongiae]|uniref:Immunoglobulin-like domain-containing protein n=1 Tax=Rubritalea spongiae TaxID=430797 RepID=A0ABW5E7F9_9BACT
MRPKTYPFFFITLLLLFAVADAAPDRTTNRYATVEDAAYWPSVNEGDYIFFQGNSDGGDKIYAPGGDPKFLKIQLPVGNKILIYAGDYERIYINGEDCLGTKENPTIVTNLGGQVRWGYSTENNQYRTLELFNFEHLYLTGKYDAEQQTGDPAYLGHDGGEALDSGDYYERYGMWGNPKWSGPVYHGSYGNGVRIRGFQTVKVDYVSSWGGYFASFNIKTDNPSNPKEVEVDVQDCFAGFGEGEAFYISYSTGAAEQDITKLTLRNNITVFTGAEALQTDNLAEGSVIENNVCLGTATFFRHPFQARFQDNLHQLSFVEGNVTVQNNLLIGTNGALHQFRYRDANSGSVTGRTDPAANKPVTMQNNFYGFGRTTMGYMWQGDGITPYVFKGNVYGAISVPNSDDTLSVPATEESGFFNIGNNNNAISFEDNIYPAGRDLYFVSTVDGGNITRTGNQQQEAPMIQFKDSGFPNEIDWRTITFWSPTYKNTPPDSGLDKNGEFIPYQVGDIVIYYDSDGNTKFFECVQAHAGNFDPNSSPAYWSQMTWNGRDLPPFDLRIQKDTYYNYRGMGLTYNEANETSEDLTAPVISLVGGDANFKVGSPYFEPGFTALDNKDGDISGQVVAEWVGEEYDSEQIGNYLRRYQVVDAAGNVSQEVLRVVSISDTNVTITKTIKINMHQNGPVNLNDWTDLGNNTQGLLNPKGETTVTQLSDSDGNATGYVLSIDNTEGGSSEHYKTHNNGSGRAIGDFPAVVTQRGLRIRDPHENPCQLEFSNLPSNVFYDVYFTGYVAGTGNTLESTLSHTSSAQSASINVRDNASEVGLLASLPSEANGTLVVDFSTATSGGQPNISGVILQEKTAAGIASGPPSMNQPAALSVNLGETVAPIDLVLSDEDSAVNTLTLTAFTSNPEVLALDGIVLSGVGENRQVTLAPSAAGQVEVTLLLGDGVTYVPYSFQLHVNDPNKPSATPVGDGVGYDLQGDEVSNFRSTTESKSLDIDTNHTYGSEGYFFYGNGANANSNTDGSPAWVSSIGAAASNVVVLAGYDDFDDPTASIEGAVTDWTSTGIGTYRNDTADMWSELLNFTLASSAPRTFRLGVMAGNEGNADGRWDPAGFRLLYAGEVLAEVSGLETALGLVFFDITLPQGFSGELSLEGQTRDVAAGRGPSLAGVVFDAPHGEVFDAWMAEYGLAGEVASFDADADADGMPNGAEFVFGGQPSVKNHWEPTMEHQGAEIVFNFERSSIANNSTLQIFQYSENLTQWTDLPLMGDVPEEVVIGAASGGAEPITIRIDNASIRNQLFWRLKVSLNE